MLFSAHKGDVIVWNPKLTGEAEVHNSDAAFMRFIIANRNRLIHSIFSVSNNEAPWASSVVTFLPELIALKAQLKRRTT